MKVNHFLGGILLIAGTTVGVGAIALPLDTSFVGFFPSIAVFFICWLLMLVTAHFFLDVNFAVEGEPNLISMAHATLGGGGRVVTWIVYLLLLYSLIAAYIAASAPLFEQAFAVVSPLSLPKAFFFFILPVIFGGFIYFGTETVDVVNRVMMVGLGISYLFLVFFLPEHFEGKFLMRTDFRAAPIAIPAVIIAFGYHNIIPSLTTYMRHDKKKLRLTLIIGSLIPLIIYSFWQLLTLGTIPFGGSGGLAETWQKGELLTNALAKVIENRAIILVANFFLFFVIVTSFLGISLSLSDFLIDGLKIKRNRKGKSLALLLTFAPPLTFVFTYQRGFSAALNYGGVFVATLLILLPALMAWQLKEPKFYRTMGGRILLSFVIVSALSIITLTILKQRGYFDAFFFSQF